MDDRTDRAEAILAGALADALSDDDVFDSNLSLYLGVQDALAVLREQRREPEPGTIEYVLDRMADVELSASWEIPR